MSFLSKRVATVALAGAVVVVPVGWTAVAYAGPYNSPAVSTSTTTPAPGGSITITGTGFRPNSTVTIQIHSAVVTLATVTADANGNVHATVTVPANFPVGTTHTITMSGVDATGKSHVDSATVTLAAATAKPSGPTLPFTGMDAVPAAAAGAGLIGLGAFVTFAARRKRAAQQG